MDSRHLHYLYEIIELGSLTRAAERLNITQPTLTRILRSMEARVGSPLVKRGRYGVTPTEIGLRLAEEGREIAQRAIRSDEVIEHWKLGMRGEVRLGVGPMMAASVMSSFFADFLDGSAPYSLLVKAGYTAKLIADLQEDEVDAVILPSKINLQQTALHQRPLFNDSLGVFCSESNPLAYGDHDSLQVDTVANVRGTSGDPAGLIERRINGLIERRPLFILAALLEFRLETI